MTLERSLSKAAPPDEVRIVKQYVRKKRTAHLPLSASVRDTYDKPGCRSVPLREALFECLRPMPDHDELHSHGSPLSLSAGVNAPVFVPGGRHVPIGTQETADARRSSPQSNRSSLGLLVADARPFVPGTSGKFLVK